MTGDNRRTLNTPYRAKPLFPVVQACEESMSEAEREASPRDPSFSTGEVQGVLLPCGTHVGITIGPDGINIG